MNLHEAFIETLKNDKTKITTDFLKKDLKPFIKTSRQSLTSLIKLPYTILRKVKDDGVKKTYNNSKVSLKELHTGLKQIPKNFRKASSALLETLQKEIELKESSKEKSEYILKILTYFTSFSVGLLAGRAWPDKDISFFGIGKHRNVFTHSALLLIFVKLLSMFLLRILNEVEVKLEGNDDYKETLQFLKNNLMAIVAGTSVGVSAHLVQDGIFESSGTIRGPGFSSFVSDTLLDDQAFLIINAFFAALLGNEFGKETNIFSCGNDNPITK